MSEQDVLKGTIDASGNDDSSPNTKPSKERAFFFTKLIQEPVVSQDIYSIAEISKLLNMSRDQVHYLSTLKDNPLPIRKFSDGARGSFVLRAELIEWLRNCPIESQRKISGFRRLFRRLTQAISHLYNVILRVIQICNLVMSFLQTFS